MDIEFVTYKKRAQFGKPYYFVKDGPYLIENQYPNRGLQNNYIARVYIDRGTQKSTILAAHDVNTLGSEYVDRGMNHDQGGWPKELNVTDKEAVTRYKKKLEREENFVESMKLLTKPVEHAVLQNNAINIYEKYYDEAFKGFSVRESISAITSVYRDACDPPRPCSHLSWSPNCSSSFAVSYCSTNMEIVSFDDAPEAYIWDIEIPGHPQIILHSKIPIVNIEWSVRDRNFLAGGLLNGQIAFYDIRKGYTPVDVTPEIVSHQGPVHSILWTLSKTSSNFFSTAPDGVVKWWDCRYLQNFLDSMALDLSRSEKTKSPCSGSCMEYDPTIPSRYLVGTDNGYVICGNRKGTTKTEKIQWVMKTHFGPIFSVERNASYSKFFLTVGDWSARIWSEECKESAVLWTKHYKTNLTGGCWSRTRFSVFFLLREDGYLDVWDISAEQCQPVLSIKVSTQPLTCIRVEEEGRLAITGDKMGRVYLICFGERFWMPQKNERTAIASMFDRESKREKTLELRVKEMRLAMKTKLLNEEKRKEDENIFLTVTEKNVQEAEKSYWEEINRMLEEKVFAKDLESERQEYGNEDEESLLAQEESQTSKLDSKEAEEVTEFFSVSDIQLFKK